MALSLSSLKTDLDKVVSEADSVADVADGYADTLAKYAEFIPTAGPEVKSLVGLLDDATKALDSLKQGLASA